VVAVWKYREKFAATIAKELVALPADREVMRFGPSGRQFDRPRPGAYLCRAATVFCHMPNGMPGQTQEGEGP